MFVYMHSWSFILGNAWENSRLSRIIYVELLTEITSKKWDSKEMTEEAGTFNFVYSF